MKIKKRSTAQLNALVFIIGLFLILLPASVHASWWNPSWGYRNTVNIAGSASDLTNYQVKVTVNFVDSKMKSDFSDIRFISSDDVNFLSHWRESYTSSSTAKFWVKVPSIPTSGTMIYMYYDNPSAISASNGEATFDFFDKFEPSSSKWTGSGYEHSTTGTGYVHAYKSAPGSVSSDLISNLIGSGDFKAHLKIKSEHYKEHNNCGYGLALKCVSDGGESGLDPFFIYFYSNFVEKSYTISGDNLRLKLYAYAKGCENTVTLRTGSSDGLDDQCSGNSCDGLPAGVTPPSCSSGYNEINYYCEETSFYDPCCDGGCGAGHDCYGTTCREYRVCKNPSLSAEAKLWIDDLYVRKYALPEPVASFGTEELGCTIDGGSCSEDDECCSGHCKPDYDGTGKFCADASQCVHDGTVYNDGDKAPDCFNDCTERYCNSGNWDTSDCDSYTCTAGSCTLACSQTCGASCDEDSDCTQSNACGDIPGGSLCTPLQWEIITSYDCNGSCVCDYTSTCYDADDLKEACEICNGSIWDPITSRCCGDDGVSDTWCNDGNGACINGIWYPDHCQDGVQNCDELEIDCGGEYGDCCTCDGQFCLTGDECCSGSCALGLCMLLENLEMQFADNASGSVTLVLGSQSDLVLKVRNNLPVKDTIRLQMIDYSDLKIYYWSKFNNNDKSIDIEIAPDEEVLVPITVFAGQTGTYELKVFAESLSYNSLTAHGSRIIYITSDDDSGLFSRSPGLSWLCLIIIALIGSLVLQKRMCL